MLKIYCDGACSNNPGSGAWAYIVFFNDEMIAQASGVELDTTNNRMELMAAIKALELLSEKDNVELIVDSKYVKDGITLWIKNWKVNGWKSSSGAVKNRDLWEKLDLLNSSKKIIWKWEKGHNKSLHDHVDLLARESVLK